MIKRSIYYLSKNYESQLSEGEDYSIISKTVSINILRFNYLSSEKNFHNAYRFKNIENSLELTDIVELHFIEIPKFGKKEIKELEKAINRFNNDKIELTNDDLLKIWTLFLKNPQDENILDVEKNVFELNQAKKELVIMSQDEKMRELYEMRQASLHDRVSALGGAFRKGYEKAFKLVEKAEKEKEKAEKEKEKAQILLKTSIKTLLSVGLSKEKIAETLNISIKILDEYL